MTSQEFPNSATLGAARAHLNKNAWDGTVCPCCRQPVKVYKRSIHARIALAAIQLYHATTVGEYAHLPTVEATGRGGRGGEGGKLRYWGLAVEEVERREDGGRSGWWCLTPDGRAFVEGSHRVQRFALVLAGQLRKLTGDLVSIEDCLGKRFNYRELMGGDGRA